MVQINRAADKIIGQLYDLAGKMSDEEFTKFLPVLLDHSIGRHYRHIIEFFQVMLDGADTGEINYDRRKHDPGLEQNREHCRERLHEIRQAVSLRTAGKLTLRGSYERDGDTTFTLSSSFERELVYNIEHAIHHQAIIRIALQHAFPHVQPDREYGYAFSTLKYMDQ
jgi:hypothetical protein